MRRDVCIACVPDAVEGDYVMVHAGVAISRVDPEEAARVLDALRQLGVDEEPADVTDGPPDDDGASPG
jgi:hydrogenase expression/formation protein HypC